MCGRFALNDKVNEAISTFVATGGTAEDWRPSDWDANYNTAPTNRSPIIREHADRDTGEVSRDMDWDAVWDFRPTWLKNPAPQINARIERVLSSSQWRPAFLSHRALVPMNGYFEWKEIAGKKQPFFIHAPNELLTAAGLYVPVKTDDGWQTRFAIITRPARDASGEIHDRMPVFLTPDAVDAWLAPGELEDPDATLDMITGVSEQIAGTITTYPVSPRINNTRAKDNWADPSILDEVPLPA